MSAIIENKWNIKGIQKLPVLAAGGTENIRENFITKRFTQCKTLCTLKIDDIEILRNKNIVKLFSKYVLLFLDQANSNSDLSQTLILEFPKPGAFLSPSPFPSNFTLANWKLYSTQSSCFSSVSPFFPNPCDHMPPQLFDILNHMPSQANQIYYQAISRP